MRTSRLRLPLVTKRCDPFKYPILAPETARDGTTMVTSDGWSLGCVLDYFVAGLVSFAECSSYVEVICKIGFRQPFYMGALEALRVELGDRLVNLIKSCIRVNPAEEHLTHVLCLDPLLFIL